MQPEHLTVQNVNALQDNGKRWLEHLLGHHLKANQQVFIMVFTPGVEPSDASRRGALAHVQKVMSEAELNLSRQAVSGEQFESAVDEVMEEVRRRKP